MLMRRRRLDWMCVPVTAALMLVVAGSPAATQNTPSVIGEVPLPQPRPAQTRAKPERPANGRAEQAGRNDETEVITQAGPRFDLDEAKRCEARLRQDGVRFALLDPIDDGNGCGTQRPLRVTRVAGGVMISTDVRLRCHAARALHDWIDQVVVPSARTHLDAKLVGVRISTSYQCRRRNNATTGKLSEHAFANGVDVMAFVFAERAPALVASRPDSADAVRAFQAAARGGACAYFTTVLGPGMSPFHTNHFHLDLAERSSGYRLCQ